MRRRCLLAGLLLLLTACGGEDDRSDPASAEASVGVTPSATWSGSPVLPDGPLEPGRYRYVLRDWDTCDPHLGCRVRPPRPAPDVEVTVPEGWEASNEFHLLSPTTGKGTEAPDGAALVLGWTTYWVGLNAEPCLPIGIPGGHQVPDVRVGPTVDDFVDAVVAHPTLHVTAPKEVRLGGHLGWSFTLRAPADLSRCDNWRPWDPGFYAQGPKNTWDVWVVDVKGFRVVVVTDYFPGTPARVRDQLREMVASLRFVT